MHLAQNMNMSSVMDIMIIMILEYNYKHNDNSIITWMYIKRQSTAA